MSRSCIGYSHSKPSISSTDGLVQLWHHRDMDARKKELLARAASRDAHARAMRRAEQERDLSDADIQRRMDQIQSEMQQLWGKGSCPRLHSAGPKDKRSRPSSRELLPYPAQELTETVQIGVPETAQRPPRPEAARSDRRRAAAERGHALPPSPETAQRPPSPEAAGRPPNPDAARCPPSPEAAQLPPSPEAARRPPSPGPGQRPPNPEAARRSTSTEVAERSPPRRPSAAFAGSQIFAPEAMHALNQPFLNAQQDVVIRTFTRNVQRRRERARSATRQRLQSNAEQRLRKDSHAATMARLRRQLEDEQDQVRTRSCAQESQPPSFTPPPSRPPAPHRILAALAAPSDGKRALRLPRCTQARQRKLNAIDLKLQRARVVREAVDEDKSTRVLREKETVSWAPSSPSRPSLVAGASVERCAPHLGLHAVIRPGLRGSLARTDSSLLHLSGGEPAHARRPSTSELPTLRGNPTLRGASIGRFDGAGFVAPSGAFRGAKHGRAGHRELELCELEPR